MNKRVYAVEKKNNRGHYYLYKETTLCRENGKGGFFFYASSEKNLGEKKEQMICCGDGFNDKSMIAFAGLGVAMANAQPEVKEVADYITTSNDEDGVALVIDRFM